MDVNAILMTSNPRNWKAKSGDEEWEAIKITVDSGAVDTVGPKGIATGVPIQSTEASELQVTPKRAVHGTKRKQGLHV